MRFAPRQKQVIDLLFQSMSYKEIGEEMGITARTVKAHVNSIARRLHIDTRRYITRVRIVYLLQDSYNVTIQ